MMKVVQADFNNVREDGTIFVSTRRLQDVSQGQTVLVQDPGDDVRYEAQVVRIESAAHRVQLKVDWDARPGYARVRNNSSGHWLLPLGSSRGAEPIVGRIGELVA